MKRIVSTPCRFCNIHLFASNESGKNRFRFYAGGLFNQDRIIILINRQLAIFTMEQSLWGMPDIINS
jgi:hypothetical protein